MTTQMTPGQARVIDPILTTVAQGYKNSEYVGFTLFPAVPVALRGGKIIKFGDEAFTVYDTERAPGAAVKRVQLGYTDGDKYVLENHSLAAVVPYEIQSEAEQYPGIDVTSRSVTGVMKSMGLGLEVQQRNLALDATRYDNNHKVALSGTDKWSDPGSNPIKQIDNYRNAVRSSIGVKPNSMVMSAVDWIAFKNNPNVLLKIQFTQTALVDVQLAMRLLGLDQLKIGEAVFKNPVTGQRQDVWDGGSVLAYTNIGSLSAEEPSYGYTYRYKGNPTVDQPWYDHDVKSWVYPVTDEREPVVSGITAGFLVQGAA